MAIRDNKHLFKKAYVILSVLLIFVIIAEYAIIQQKQVNIKDSSSAIALTIQGQYHDEMRVFCDILDTILENDMSDEKIGFLKGELSLITTTELNFENVYEVVPDKNIAEDMFDEEIFYQTTDAVRSLKRYLLELNDTLGNKYSKGVYVYDILNDTEFVQLNTVLKEETYMVCEDFFSDADKEKQNEWLSHMEIIEDASLKLFEICKNYVPNYITESVG